MNVLIFLDDCLSYFASRNRSILTETGLYLSKQVFISSRDNNKSFFKKIISKVAIKSISI